MRAFLFLLLLCGSNLMGQYTNTGTDSSVSVKTIAVVPRQAVGTTKAPPIPAARARQQYMGFNTSYLLQQILPFNAIPIQQNMYGITYRRYRSNRGLRLSFGANLSELEEIQWLGLRVDKERRKKINQHWTYFYGTGGGIEIFQDPERNAFFFEPVEVNLIGQMHFGIEYHINQVMSLSFESQGIIKLGSSNALMLRPPTVITAHFSLD